jgi:hypothetical protein
MNECQICFTNSRTGYEDRHRADTQNGPYNKDRATSWCVRVVVAVPDARKCHEA